MKILISYFTQTGNTEKVAKAMFEALAEEDVEMKKVQDVDPTNLASYDLLLLGSGIYASKASKRVLTLIKAATELPLNIALFCTHMSLDQWQRGFRMVKKNLEKRNINVIAEFDCNGENLGMPESEQDRMLEMLPPEKKQDALEYRKSIKGRPNADDIEKAKAFASTLLDKIK
jgi:flavodoxin